MSLQLSSSSADLDMLGTALPGEIRNERQRAQIRVMQQISERAARWLRGGTVGIRRRYVRESGGDS